MTLANAVVTGVLVLAVLIGCGHGPQPSIDTTPDARSEAILTQWEAEASRMMREGCRIRDLQLVCRW